MSAPQAHAPEEADHYSGWADGALVGVDGPVDRLTDRVHGALRAVILDPEFPCVGARAALNRGTYRFSLYEELDSEAATRGLARDIHRFIREEPHLGGEFTTFIASFQGPKVIEPEQFETLLWAQLRRLHEVDDEPWDPTVSREPDDGRFSFSFAGKAFFIVGLSPTGARWGRRFPWPTLAFNPHEQFERLRADGRFEQLRDTVRARDVQLEGNLNPNLADYGAHTEARQYSGREVAHDWRCPVRFD